MTWREEDIGKSLPLNVLFVWSLDQIPLIALHNPIVP